MPAAYHLDSTTATSPILKLTGSMTDSEDARYSTLLQPPASGAVARPTSSSPSQLASAHCTTVKTRETLSSSSRYDEIPHSKIARKRNPNAQSDVEAAIHLSDDEPVDQIVSKKSRTLKAATLAIEAPTERSRLLDHTILQSLGDIELFISLFEKEGSVPKQYRILEIHLDASKPDEYADYRIAMALNLLHPRLDGTNPHSYQAMKLVMKGKFLYTRYSYKLASPAVSKQASLLLKKLALGKLSQAEQSSLEYKVNSTEKTVAKALLGIRGLGKVCFAGGGRVEGLFAQVLRDTVVRVPLTGIVEPAPDTTPAHTIGLFREGMIDSSIYQAALRGTPDHPGFDLQPRKRVNSRRSNSATLDDDRDKRQDMANLKPMNTVDINNHKSDWSNWFAWKGLTDDGLTVELGWKI
ncbi:hypothetical protein BDU57DRAFT_216866 [Ampelomyces quisqualis]|uniref:Uncharacterized protein n=1 Tax=Ampelomyces quisqualis TaxID=50730 RepID=A0A6A5QK53_AMPQU|nr:hypothetical protein BDU57DRAFT_216866 [Ampelomyces quisqualis]